ncbi:MAG: hypothetical protein V3U27_05155, partial [Candidatus Tectomicrobia bacterium]
PRLVGSAAQDSVENRKETQYDEAGGKQEGMGRDVSRLLPPLLARWESIQATDTFAKQAKHLTLPIAHFSEYWCGLPAEAS